MSGGFGLPEPLGASVSRELERLGRPPDGQSGMAELVSRWPCAVGDVVARNAWPARYAKDGTLVVHTRSSAWAFELAQLEGMIRAQLGEAAPRRLRFVPGPLPDLRTEAVPPAPSSCRSPDEPDPESRSQAESLTAGIASPELRDALARAAALSLARARAARGPAGGSDTLRSA